MRKNLITLATLAALGVGTGQAQVHPGNTNRNCAFSDLSSVTVTECAGFHSGNLLDGNTGDTVSATIAGILSTMGVANANTATYVEKVGSFGGSQTINFATPLSGDTIVALHFGQGSNKFDGAPAYNGRGGGTAFYRFDAGASLDSFTTALTASSGGAIFQTTAVPEPGTYAMLLAGLAAVGFMSRRRRA